ncbi:MAG: cytochrome bc complex cytochrome b subunit [Chloroflexota bacterium]
MQNTAKLQDLRDRAWKAIDHRTRIITAGMGLDELRRAMRGEPPAEKPNPRYKVHTTSFLFHIRPRYYEAGSTIFSHTYRLGFFTAFFFFVELFTGLILMIYYTPSPEKAYTSILNLLNNVPFGQMLRDIHRLGAEGMVIFTALHMLRTFLTGSYKKDRSFTWLTGVALLGITMFLSFSGYLLPWDQLAYWAVTVGTSMAEAAPLFGNEVNLLMRGAPDIAANGLLRFYLLHVVLLPLASILVISIHYYKVSREHGISLPAKFEEGDVPPEVKKAAKQRIDYIPDLLTGEVFWTSLGLLALVLGVTVLGYHAPLESIANPQVTPLDTKAPWYFWWLQGMLKIDPARILGDALALVGINLELGKVLSSKVIMGIIIPTILVGVLVGVPYIDRNPHRSLWKRPWAVAIGVFSLLILVVLSYMGLPEYGIEMEPAQRIIQDMAPMEGEGPLRLIPYDQLQAGSYEVGSTVPENLCPALDFGCPELESFFKLYAGRIDQAIAQGRLPKETQAVLVVEDWQAELAKLTLRIVWPADGKSKSYERVVYLHALRGSH